MADPTPFDWGSTRRTLMSVLPPLLAMGLARWGWDAEKVGATLNQVFTIVDVVLALSGPLYALGSQIRATLSDHHDAKVEVAAVQANVAMASIQAAAPGSLVAQAREVSQ
jgi:hypothetical protein